MSNPYDALARRNRQEIRHALRRQRFARRRRTLLVWFAGSYLCLLAAFWLIFSV